MSIFSQRRVKRVMIASVISVATLKLATSIVITAIHQPPNEQVWLAAQYFNFLSQSEWTGLLIFTIGIIAGGYIETKLRGN